MSASHVSHIPSSQAPDNGNPVVSSGGKITKTPRIPRSHPPAAFRHTPLLKTDISDDVRQVLEVVTGLAARSFDQGARPSSEVHRDGFLGSDDGTVGLHDKLVDKIHGEAYSYSCSNPSGKVVGHYHVSSNGVRAASESSSGGGYFVAGGVGGERVAG